MPHKDTGCQGQIRKSRLSAEIAESEGHVLEIATANLKGYDSEEIPAGRRQEEDGECESAVRAEILE